MWITEEKTTLQILLSASNINIHLFCHDRLYYPWCPVHHTNPWFNINKIKYLKRRLQSPLLKYTYFIGAPPLFLIISWSSGSSFETAMELQYGKQNKKHRFIIHYTLWNIVNKPHFQQYSLGCKWLCKTDWIFLF